MNEMTSSGYNRRAFLGNSARNAAGVAAGVLSLGMKQRSPSPNDQINIGVIGVGEQGRELAETFSSLKQGRIVAVCDIDVRSAGEAQHRLADHPVIIPHHEKLLERSDIDAVIIATPDHWHAKMTADAFHAGKDVYLETPVTHTIHEGNQLLKLSQQTGRIVQTGLPHRSGAHFQSAVQLIQSGQLGKISSAKAWAVHRRRSIGRAATVKTPIGVDYDRWLGPATERPFQPNRFHRNWTCFWDYGSGELGHWGVQYLDLIRWGLKLDLPSRVAAHGGQRHFHDDRETPDTLAVQFEFPEIDVLWEHRQWSHHGIEGRSSGAAFYGEAGTLVIDRSGWKVYGGPEGLYADASEIRKSHLSNWLDSISTRQPTNADLQTGHLSATLCHLGNLSYRLRREIQFDASSSSFRNDDDANSLLVAQSRSPWELSEG